jgi:signal peptidase II
MTAARILLAVTLPLYVLDQITKWWVVMNFPEPQVGRTASEKMIPVIEGYFNLVRVHNQGVAFGFGNGTVWAPIVFLFVSAGALVALIWCWRKGYFAGAMLHWAAALLVTGICGNLTDRLMQGFFLEEVRSEGFLTRLSRGYVVDFLDFTIPLVNYRWPSFNVADSCICVAAFLLIVSTFRAEKVSEPLTAEPKES